MTWACGEQLGTALTDLIRENTTKWEESQSPERTVMTGMHFTPCKG
jgi:hypothetical protein